MMTETNAKPIEPTCSMCPSYPRIQAELSRLTAECQKWQEYHDAEYRERKKYRQDANYFAGEVDRLTSELKRMESECERRGKELLAIHKVLKDNVNDPDPLPASSPYCVSAPTTYGLVAGIVRERDELKKQAAAAESLAASLLADQEAIERHTRNTAMNDFIAFIKEWYENPCHDFLSSALCTGRKCGDCIEAEIRKKYGVE